MPPRAPRWTLALVATLACEPSVPTAPASVPTAPASVPTAPVPTAPAPRPVAPAPGPSPDREPPSPAEVSVSKDSLDVAPTDAPEAPPQPAPAKKPAPKDSRLRLDVKPPDLWNTPQKGKRELVRQTLRGAEFSRCGAPRPPRAIYRITVRADGTVGSIAVLDADDRPLTGPAHVCAAEVVRGLQFPAGVGPVAISFPLL